MNTNTGADGESTQVEVATLNELTDDMRNVLSIASGYALSLLQQPVDWLIILLSATMAYLTAWRIRRPIRSLSAAAVRLQEGDLTTPVPRLTDTDFTPLSQQLEATRVAMEMRWEAVARKEARQSALLVALHEPIIATDANGQILDHSPAVALLLGETTAVTGHQLREFLPFISAQENGTSSAGLSTGSFVNPAGAPVYLEVRHSRLPETMEPATDLYVLHDISPYAELIRAREDLLYNAAHELRALMATVQVSLDFLVTEGNSLSIADFGYYLGAASNSTMRYRDLLENLLSAGSIRTGRFQVRLELTDLRSIIDDALDTISMTIEQRKQRVDCQLSEVPLYVMADPRYARLVIVNVLSNASKYSPNEADIRLSTEEADGYVRLSIADSGPGISPEQQMNIFDRYYRAAPQHESPGVGLGLAIAKGIMEAHMGFIGVDSQIGVGTDVWIAFLEAEAGSHEDSSGGR